MANNKSAQATDPDNPIEALIGMTPVRLRVRPNHETGAVELEVLDEQPLVLVLGIQPAMALVMALMASAMRLQQAASHGMGDDGQAPLDHGGAR